MENRKEEEKVGARIRQPQFDTTMLKIASEIRFEARAAFGVPGWCPESKSLPWCAKRRGCRCLCGIMYAISLV